MGTSYGLLTGETQRGSMCRLGKLLASGRMHEYHQIWLEGLKKKAEKET